MDARTANQHRTGRLNAVELRVHRAAWCVLAAILALASCGHSRAAPTPTIEYRTPPPQHVGDRVAEIPNPPPCDCDGPGLPTETPTATPTPIPIATPAPETVAAQSVAQVGTVSPTSAQYDGRCGPYPDAVTRWWGEVTRYDWDWCTALWVIYRESGGQNVYNYEGSGACGVMQLLPCMFPDDGVANIEYGYWHKYVPSGWAPWAVMEQ